MLSLHGSCPFVVGVILWLDCRGDRVVIPLLAMAVCERLSLLLEFLELAEEELLVVVELLLLMLDLLHLLPRALLLGGVLEEECPFTLGC